MTGFDLWKDILFTPVNVRLLHSGFPIYTKEENILIITHIVIDIAKVNNALINVSLPALKKLTPLICPITVHISFPSPRARKTPDKTDIINIDAVSDRLVIISCFFTAPRFL